MTSTAALNLLCGARGPQAIVQHLDDTIDYETWRPVAGAVDGYLVEGTLGGLVRNGVAVTAIAARLREADAAMVAVIPDDPGLEAELELALGPALVRCTPPDACRVFQVRLSVAVPGEAERDRLLSGLPEDLVPALLPPGTSPRNAEDLVDAVLTAGEVDEPRRRATVIRQTLADQADREIARLMPTLDEPKTLSAVAAAAVFGGWGPHVVAEQARHLLCALKGGSAAPVRLEEQCLTALLEGFGIRTFSIRKPGRQPATRMVFNRSQWPAAILRHLWRSEAMRRHLVAWLQVTGSAELIGCAGWALALSIPQQQGSGRLRQIQECATSSQRPGQAVAAQALRVLLADPDLSREVAGQLARWAYSHDRNLRIVTALTLGGGAEITPPEQALPLLRRLVHGAELAVDRFVDEAVDMAVLDLFTRGNRMAVLKALHGWADSGAEAIWVARMLPRLLRCDFGWFGAQITEGDDFFVLLVLLIRGALRVREGNAALRDAVQLWRRAAAWNTERAEALEAVLDVVGTDAHPRVQRFLDAIDRQI